MSLCLCVYLQCRTETANEDVVDADERNAEGLRKALRGVEPDDERGREPRTIRDRDGIDRVPRVFSVIVFSVTALGVICDLRPYCGPK